MHAIIRAGSRQYRVESGNIIHMERLEIEPGAAFETNDILLVANGDSIQVGAPTVSGAVVKGTVLDHIKGKKVIVFKRRRRKGYRHKQGHRHFFTRVQINSIEVQ